MFVVFIHELGHFIAAKLSGVKVYEFGIGIPPKAFILFTDKSGTNYTLNWIPLGGFVRLKGEEVSDDPYDRDSLVHKPLWKKSCVVLAGVAMNFLLA
jgi:regulator of sigma E protease